MNKKILLGIVVCALGLSVIGCGKKADTKTEDNKIEKEVDVNKENVKDVQDDQVESGLSYKDFSNIEFTFSSGAGGWATFLFINEDGTFEGSYHDSEMGVIEEDYPKGTLYLSNFKGKFGELEKVDDYTYKTTLESIEYENEVDTEETNDGIHYIYTDAYGVAGGAEFYFYLKDSEIASLPGKFVDWVSIDLTSEDTKLPFIGLYNVKEGLGFTGWENDV